MKKTEETPEQPAQKDAYVLFPEEVNLIKEVYIESKGDNAVKLNAILSLLNRRGTVTVNVKNEQTAAE